jgi:hypothetical protein
LIIAQALDGGAGVDPLSLVLSYQGVLIGASAYDPFSGLALFGLPSQAPKLRTGTTRAIIAASDYQEAKNIDTVGTDLLPNTSFKLGKLKVVNGPAVTWIEPPANACAITKDRLVAVADSTTKITKVQFFDGTRLVGTRKSGPGGIFSVPWSTRGLDKGKHSMTVVAVDRSGRKAVARRQLRVCK